MRQTLGIAGVATKTFAYQAEGAQVDMVIERADKSVCVCETKWSALPYCIAKTENTKIRNRLAVVKEKYPRYALMMVVVTSSGLVRNEYAASTVQRVVKIENLAG